MHCKSCNTRVPTGASKCENCGAAGSLDRQAPGPAAEEMGSGRGLLGLSSAKREIAIDELLDPGPDVSQRSEPAKPAPSRARSTHTGSGSSSGVSSLDSKPRPSEIRALVAENPSLIEPGLSIYRRKGRAVGENFETDVGTIDLLVTDEDGGLVLILVATPSSEDIVSDMLNMIGWARKHLRKARQDVRGIVLAESLPEEVEYAAAAVVDTISFKTYQIKLCFSDLEL